MVVVTIVEKRTIYEELGDVLRKHIPEIDNLKRLQTFRYNQTKALFHAVHSRIPT